MTIHSFSGTYKSQRFDKNFFISSASKWLYQQVCWYAAAATPAAIAGSSADIFSPSTAADVTDIHSHAAFYTDAQCITVSQ